MDQACEDIDQMFSNLLGEMDLLTQSLEVEIGPPPPAKIPDNEFNFAVGFKDLNESLNTLEDTDLDALMADLVADISEVEKKTATQGQTDASHYQQAATIPPSTNAAYDPQSYVAVEQDLPPPPVDLAVDPPLPFPLPPPATKSLTKEEQEAQAKADKIKLALEKMKEAKVKKLVVKVHMKDNSTKSLMVDERQTARDILDNLFEKTHCDCRVDWCLYEVYPELQIERVFEDHENVVEILSDWTRDSENKILFLYKSEKYDLFKNPQNFYLTSKGKNENKEMNEKSKEALLEESFCGTSLIVPELEGALYLKEDGKKSWKRRYFLLRASGIYYVPKGKTKTSRDLACFIQFANVNIYYGMQSKVRYKAPTDYCFVLKGIQCHLLDLANYYKNAKKKVAVENHPQIQKESQYIKYLCCDDKESLHKWVTGIRIAKYGKTLYDNYKCALQKASLASQWRTPGNAERTTAAKSSPKGRTQANGQIPQATTIPTEDASESGKRTETPKANRSDSISNSTPMVPPSPSQLKHHRKPGGMQPPPPPQRRSSAVPTSLLATRTETASTAFASDPAEFPPPPELIPPPPEPEDLPPPPPDFYEAPPDFVPPPPPPFNNGDPELPPPPPPPPASVSVPTLPPPVRKKMVPPPPPKRQEASRGQGGDSKPSEPLPSGDAAGQGDLMSDLMRVLQKKRAELS